MQFRGPKLYKKRGHYFKNNLTCRESLGLYLKINIDFISSTLYFDGKFSSVSLASRPPMIGKTTMFWSSTLWSWRHNAGAQELSTNHMCKAWQPRAGSTIDRFWSGCHVDAMAVVRQNHIGKNTEITLKLRPSIHNRIAKLFMKAKRYQIWTILVEIVPPLGSM